MENREVEKKSQNLSSWNRKRSGRKNAEKKELRPNVKTRGKHQCSGCGSETGKAKGNQQKAKYLEPGMKHGKPGGRNGENGEPKGEPKHRGGPVRRKREESER